MEGAAKFGHSKSGFTVQFDLHNVVLSSDTYFDTLFCKNYIKIHKYYLTNTVLKKIVILIDNW